MRLAEVWMDEYKRLFYTHRRDLLVSITSVRLAEVWMEEYKKIVLNSQERFIGKYKICEVSRGMDGRI